MQAAKTVVAENFGKAIPAHGLAPAAARFALSDVPDLSSRVAVVTGGSEGIGYGCTHTLLSRHIAKLFVLSKSEDVATQCIDAVRGEMGADAANKVAWMPCDLSDWAQTAQTAFAIAQQTDRLDILINNAGRGIMSVQRAANGVDLHMATNHIGHVVLTSHLLPLLKKTAASGETVRIVNLASNAHQGAPDDVRFASLDELNKDYGPMAQYGRSKLANILYSRYLAKHLTAQHPRILANATHPGFVETRQSMEHIKDAYPLGGFLMSHTVKPFQKDQFEGAVSTMYAATMADQSGQYICPPAVVEQGSEKANDMDLAEQLMDLTWKVVREKTQPASEQKGCPFKEY